ncbi:MAG: cytochrome P450 [Anaerolineae bacterium]
MTVAIKSFENVKISSGKFKANPYPFYAYMRESQPLYRTKYIDGRPVWLVARYDDVLRLLKDDRLVKNRHNALLQKQPSKFEVPMPAVFRAMERNMLDLDPPDHTRLRGLVHKAFTPQLVEKMRQQVQELADQLVDSMVRKGQADIMADYALPIPLTIISEILGIPAHDQHKFHNWTTRIVSVQSPSQMIFVIPALLSFARYMRALLEQRRTDPQDDLLTALVQAEEAGDKLSADELLAMAFLLVTAGHETTVNLIGNGTLALLENPDQLERLRQEPALIKPAIEEFVRYYSPVEIATERFASEDMTIAGVDIHKGDMVMGVIASANRDETQFPNADRLDISREPNRHLGFGQGMHYCVGAPLARLEAQVAFQTLINRLPDLRLAVKRDDIRWRSTFVIRGMESMPVHF